MFKIRLLKLPEGVTVMEIETKKNRLIEIMEKVSFDYLIPYNIKVINHYARPLKSFRNNSSSET